jgi:hypothetical protein
LLLVPFCCLLSASAYLLWPHAAPIAAPTEAPIAPLAPAAVIDCGPWTYADGMTFAGNTSQDVCQIGEDLTAIRAGTTAYFSRSSEFTLAICAASVSNTDGDMWTFGDCGQTDGVTFPAGTYTIQQPDNYANGGFRATNK